MSCCIKSLEPTETLPFTSRGKVGEPVAIPIVEASKVPVTANILFVKERFCSACAVLLLIEVNKYPVDAFTIVEKPTPWGPWGPV